MAWRERLVPVRMARVALTAPKDRWDEVLMLVASTGAFEPDPSGTGSTRTDDAAPTERDAVLALRHEQSLETSRSAVLVGWAPATALAPLREAIAPAGGAIVELDIPRWTSPPTLLSDASTQSSFAPLVSTYATVGYHDVDPTAFAAVAYLVMFGLMFGDVGHGLMLAAIGVAARFLGGPIGRLRRVWIALVAAGTVAAIGGLLYGEAFGPTGLVPVLWLEPLDEPLRLLVAALLIGVVLLTGAYTLGSINRWREGGLAMALYSPSGVAGSAVFLGGAVSVAGWYWERTLLTSVGAVVAGLGVVLLAVGFWSRADRNATGVLTTVVELFDALLRLGSNVVSFTRVAAFGLTHSAIGAAVWAGTVALWGGVVGSIAAIALFIVGNLFAFSLELLVAGVQGLRLEYYELFSRVFEGEGRPFRPWYEPLEPAGTKKEG